MFNEYSLKRMPFLHLEIKLILALQYCLVKDYELFNQLINSIQRQIRHLGKSNCTYILLFTKILKMSLNDLKKSKATKIQSYINKLNKAKPAYFSPLQFIKMDEEFISRLS